MRAASHQQLGSAAFVPVYDRDDVLAEHSAHSGDTYHGHLSTHNLLPASPLLSRSDTLSYRTNESSLTQSTFEATNADGDTDEAHILHSSWLEGVSLQNLDFELSGMGQMIWDGPPDPSNLLHTIGPAYDTWAQELGCTDMFGPKLVPESNAHSMIGCPKRSYPSDCRTSYDTALSACVQANFTSNSPLAYFDSDESNMDHFRLPPDEPPEMNSPSMDSSIVTQRKTRRMLYSSSPSLYGDSTLGEDGTLGGDGTFGGDEWSWLDTAISTGTTADAPELSAPLTQDAEHVLSSEQKTKFPCSNPGCSTKFLHQADLTRHLRTIHNITTHNKARKTYRCVFEDCPKAYKVWTRLDSFKQHVFGQHADADGDDLVRKACREDHGLRVSLTTPISMSQKEHLKNTRGASRIRHPISL